MFDTAITSFALLVVFKYIFLLCEPGQRMINRFDKFDNELVEFDWYLLPIEMQPMYMIFVSTTQNPLKVSSYGGIMCERETAKKVTTVFEYRPVFERHWILSLNLSSSGY